MFYRVEEEGEEWAGRAHAQRSIDNADLKARQKK